MKAALQHAQYKSHLHKQREFRAAFRRHYREKKAVIVQLRTSLQQCQSENEQLRREAAMLRRAAEHVRRTAEGGTPLAGEDALDPAEAPQRKVDRPPEPTPEYGIVQREKLPTPQRQPSPAVPNLSGETLVSDGSPHALAAADAGTAVAESNMKPVLQAAEASPQAAAHGWPPAEGERNLTADGWHRPERPAGPLKKEGHTGGQAPDSRSNFAGAGLQTAAERAAADLAVPISEEAYTALSRLPAAQLQSGLHVSANLVQAARSAPQVLQDDGGMGPRERASSRPSSQNDQPDALQPGPHQADVLTAAQVVAQRVSLVSVSNCCVGAGLAEGRRAAAEPRRHAEQPGAADAQASRGWKRKRGRAEHFMPDELPAALRIAPQSVGADAASDGRVGPSQLSVLERIMDRPAAALSAGGEDDDDGALPSILLAAACCVR